MILRYKYLQVARNSVVYDKASMLISVINNLYCKSQHLSVAEIEHINQIPRKTDVSSVQECKRGKNIKF